MAILLAAAFPFRRRWSCAGAGAVITLVTWMVGCGQPNRAVDSSRPAAGSSSEDDGTAPLEFKPETTAKGNTKPGSSSAVHALLVGCTKYDHLPDYRQLEGPANDVALFSRLLEEKFGFPRKSLTTLVEGEGAAARPTRANIEREFQRLAKIAAGGDRVVIFLAGHGSQQPTDPKGQQEIEPDGLDEVFCPADVASLVAGDDLKIKNGIVDKQFKVWLEAILNTGASVWLVVDACHSGTIERRPIGLGDKNAEVVRSFDPVELLPAAEREKIRQPAAASRGGTPRVAAMTFPDKTKGTLVALCATQPHEETVEATLGGEWHGIFTYAICQALAQCDKPISYRELVQRVHTRFRREDRYRPTPLLEGQIDEATRADSRDRLVLGRETVPKRSLMSIHRTDEGNYQVNAGSLHDLSVGSVLAIYPPAGQPDQDRPLGHVKITALELLRARAEPCAFGELPQRADFPRDNRAQVAFIDYGLRQLKVAVDPQAESELPQSNKAPPTVAPLAVNRLAELRAWLRKLTAETPNETAERIGKLVAVVDDPARADWLIRVSGGKPYLVHRSVVIGVASDDPLIFDLSPAAATSDDEFVRWLMDRMTRIANATCLVQLAAAVQQATQGGTALNLDVELFQCDDKSGESPATVVWQREGPQLRPGKFLGLRITNRGPADVDCWPFVVDSRFGIGYLRLGTATGDNCVRGKESRCKVFARISGKTVGLENLVVIAVKARSQQASDFDFLKQPDCDQEWPERSTNTIPQTRGTDHALRQLLIHLKSDVSQARGEEPTWGDHTLRLFTWRTTAD